MANSMAFGQDYRRGRRPYTGRVCPVSAMEGEFELINLILDFAPGAATPAAYPWRAGHRHRADEEMVFGMEGKPDLHREARGCLP